MISCAVVGATGYTGLEVVRLLLGHPFADLTVLTTRQKDAIPLETLLPDVHSSKKYKITNYSFAEVKKKADVIFLCLPHKESALTAKKFYEAGKTVIDLSADLRLGRPKLYDEWYGMKHPVPELLPQSVYGLTEFFRSKIAKSNLIANPGCYPTGSLLGLLPLARRKLVDMSWVVINASSGVSGAGKKAVPATHFCAVDENYQAYKVGKHQHTPEISGVLQRFSGVKPGLVFTTHLLPVDRGILSTICVKVKRGVTETRLRKAFAEDYGKETFVRLLEPGIFPSLKNVLRTNFCDIGIHFNKTQKTAIIITAIDNLVKGAAGQAVQNMNVRFGRDESEGLCK